MSYFGYNPGDVPEGAFKISPSQLSRFFDETSGWTREFLLGETGFTGNTASHLGNVVHGLANMYMEQGAVDYALAEEYIASIDDPEVDKLYIQSKYATMFETLTNSFLVGASGVPELFLKEEVAPGIYLGGSIDLLNPEEVQDYKTTGALSAPTSIRRSYYFQQLCYVWLARKKGYPVKRFRLVYVTVPQIGRISETTGKPLKDYPSKVTELVHEVTNEDIELIEGVIKLVADFVKAWKAHPELRHVLAQDYRLKVAGPVVSIFNKEVK